MSPHPYKSLPSYAFWRQSIAELPYEAVDPVVQGRFSVGRTDRVATAGSCFAQHIARYLSQHGFNYFVAETAHPLVLEQAGSDFNYGTFTARYGNIYTARQLNQLLKRAYGTFVPGDEIWSFGEDRFVDPFRPQIQPDGFGSREEFFADRSQHFSCVRQAVEQLDVLVFTLGLTECWQSTVDGAVYPLCPGVAGGNFDPAVHQFLNMTVSDVTADLFEAVDFIRNKNPASKVILTVSPVPLVATAENRHVLVSTTYSKSVLRVAAEQVASVRENVAYFPSYEIVTGNFNRGRYFAPDLRSVTEQGVAHVMRLFMKHYAGFADLPETQVKPSVRDPDMHTEKMAHLVELKCDEEALDHGT